MTRIVVVEDETLVRQGIVELLSLKSDFQVVAEAATGEEAVRIIPAARPDIVLMDVRLPGLSGPEAAEQLRAAGCQVPVILITTLDDDEALLRGIRAGVRGFLRKDISLGQLTRSIEAVLAGETVLRPALTDRGLDRLRTVVRPTFESSPLPEPLTPRESEVLRLMASGLSNREIAGLLGNCETTVKSHASTILSKLGVRDRTRAVLRGLELGLI
jgi:DNA-binding NarL/FixJ family response regulator